MTKVFKAADCSRNSGYQFAYVSANLHLPQV